MCWLVLAGLVALAPVAGVVAQPEPPPPPAECCTTAPPPPPVCCTEEPPPPPETTTAQPVRPPTTTSPVYVPVPPLIDLTVAGAREELRKRSLVLAAEAPDEYVVTSQDPGAGAKVTPYSAVSVEARPPAADQTTLSPRPAPLPGQVPEDPGNGSPWVTVAYVGGGGGLLALLGLLLVPLVRRWWRRPRIAGEARLVTGYPLPRVAVRDLPGRPTVTVTLRLGADPHHRRPP